MESVYSSSKTNYTCRLQPLDFPVITKFWLNDIFSAWCFQLNKLKTSIKSSPSILLVGPTSMATPPLVWWFELVEGGVVFLFFFWGDINGNFRLRLFFARRFFAVQKSLTKKRFTCNFFQSNCWLKIPLESWRLHDDASEDDPRWQQL